MMEAKKMLCRNEEKAEVRRDVDVDNESTAGK